MGDLAQNSDLSAPAKNEKGGAAATSPNALFSGEDEELLFAGVNLEVLQGAFVLSKPSVGALSALNREEVLAFVRFYPLREDQGQATKALISFYETIGRDTDQAVRATSDFLARMQRDGWFREGIPEDRSKPLAAIYFTVTRRCDLACSYCYQGLANRNNTEMTVEQASDVLGKIKRVNARAFIVVTGGEPLSHRRIFEILALIDDSGFQSVLLTNGTFLDEATAVFLKGLKNFFAIQLSMDGISEETHGLTRGMGHFCRVMRALECIIEQGLPFILAPTMHSRNLHELYEIAALAVRNGGWVSPNDLRELPQPGLNFEKIHASYDRLLDALADVGRRLEEEFGQQRIAMLRDRYQPPSDCSATSPNAKFACGMAHSIVDLDWNGDVYPCHLAKDEKLILGNAFVDDFETILARATERRIRVRSHEIEKCSACKFVSRCAGGCRAGAWFAYGTLLREDDLCSLYYQVHLARLLGSVKRC